MNEELKVIADSPKLFQAVKELFEAQFSVDDLSTNLTDESLGQVVRARVEGLRKIKNALTEIEKHRTPKVEIEKDNPAR